MARLSNKAMAEKARQYKQLKATAAQANADADVIRGELLAALDQRDESSIDVDGVRITRKVRTTRHWLADRLKDVLPRKHFAAVTTLQVDGRKVKELVKAGAVDDATLAGSFEETESAPYVDVTILDPG